MIHQATYECDKCHAIQETDEQFWTVGVKAVHHRYTSDSFVDETFKMDVCRTCLESFGIHVSRREKHEPPPPAPPTLEPLLSTSMSTLALLPSQSLKAPALVSTTANNGLISISPPKPEQLTSL